MIQKASTQFSEHVKLQISEQSVSVNIYNQQPEYIRDDHIKTIKRLQLQLNNLNSEFSKLIKKYNGLETKYHQEFSKYKNFYEKYKDAANSEPKDQSPKKF